MTQGPPEGRDQQKMQNKETFLVCWEVPSKPAPRPSQEQNQLGPVLHTAARHLHSQTGARTQGGVRQAGAFSYASKQKARHPRRETTSQAEPELSRSRKHSPPGALSGEGVKPPWGVLNRGHPRFRFTVWGEFPSAQVEMNKRTTHPSTQGETGQSWGFA